MEPKTPANIPSVVDERGIQRVGIGLVLSGGGVRAAAFHSGVLKYLAERGMLEEVSQISSVSGGSLLVGLVYSSNSYQWPSSEQYLNVSAEHVRKVLTTTNLQYCATIKLILWPPNWRFVFSRANIIAKTLKSLWNIEATVGQIPKSPCWSINGTTGETGKRFRFKDNRMGDYVLGYADIASLPLSKALAVSAAFPGGVGPLAIKSKSFKWHTHEHFASNGNSQLLAPRFKRIHLYDGGLYDNLGLEPLFDLGEQKFKTQKNVSVSKIILSDGGAPLRNTSIPGQLNPLRFRRMMDIMSDQQRALRVRSFVGFLRANNKCGAYLRLGSEAEKIITEYGKGRKNQTALLALEWLKDGQIKSASAYPTNLKRMSEKDFELLSRHGYETAKWNLELFS